MIICSEEDDEIKKEFIEAWAQDTSTKLQQKIKARTESQKYNIQELASYKNNSTKRDQILQNISAKQLAL